MNSAQAKVSVRNKLGLHARPAMSVVDVASRFESSITISRNNLTVDAKSIMQLMMLAATCESELTINADGPDAQEAVEALVELIDNQFEE